MQKSSLTFNAALPPGELSILAGASGAGKSTLVLQCLHAWTSGKSFLGILPEGIQLSPSYIVADRGAASLFDHAARMGFDLNGMKRIVSVVDDVDLDLGRIQTQPLQLLLSILTRMVDDGTNIVVIDPLMLFLGVDLNRYHIVAPPLILLNRFCKQHNLTILGIHHTTKARSDFAFLRPQDRISGSSALSAFTSTQWALWSREELPEEQMAQGLSRLDIISHVAAPATLWMRRLNNGLFSMAEMEEKEGALGQVATAVLSTLGSEPLPAGVLVSYLASSASRASVYRALDQLSSRGLIHQPSRGFYSLATPPATQE